MLLSYFLSSGRKDNFRNLRIFGCQVWVCLTGIRKQRFNEDVRKYIFLGYVPHTDRLVLYYDCYSERVKITLPIVNLMMILMTYLLSLFLLVSNN